MFSCSLFVFHRRSFSPWWPLAFLILSPPGYKIFTFFFQRNSSPLYFTSSSISFSVIHVSADIKILSGKRLGFNRCMDGVYEYTLFYKHITRERETFDVVSIVQRVLTTTFLFIDFSPCSAYVGQLFNGFDPI